MKIEIINTGSELLLGRILNTHQQWLCRELADLGYTVDRQVAVPDSAAAAQIERTRPMGAYRASTLIDFERGLPLELEALFLEPLRRARRAGVLTPRLAALCRVLQQLDDERRKSRSRGGI